jgi:hypothetical protein
VKDDFDAWFWGNIERWLYEPQTSAEFPGLTALIQESPPEKLFIKTYPPAPPFWQTLRHKRPGRRK